MECLKLENDNHKRGVAGMSRQKGNSKKVIQISLGGVIAIIVTVAVAAIGATWLIANKFGDIKGSIVALSKDVSKMSTQLNEVNTEVSRMRDYLYNDGGVKDQLGDLTTDVAEIQELLNQKPLAASSDLADDINKTSVEPNNISTTKSSFESTTVIGTDSSGHTYIAKDLIGKTILITFVQDNKEIYFLGQYNENYHWDGYCVTNTYSLNGSLHGICESTFDDGNRLDYESFYRSETKDEWIHTKRNCTKDKNGQAVNEGTTTKYSFHYNKTKNFTITNVRVSDILYCKNFKDSKNKIMTSYYDGATSSGSYNDKSGDAYLIKYDKSGYIRTFYKGKFEDGNFQDDNALEIVFDDSNGVNRYFVYTGSFSDGDRKSDKGIRYVTQAEIDKIMKENKLPDDLNWYK